MARVLQRNAALFIGLVLAGLACAMAVPYFISARGAAGPTVLQAQSPVAALAAVVICGALATVIACGVGRFSNAAVGLFVLGAGFFVLAGRLETMREFAFATAASSSRSALMLLALETLVWAALMLGAVLAVFKVAGPLNDVNPIDEYTPPAHPILSVEALKSAAAGLLVLPVVWAVAQSPMKGQVIAAAFMGAMAAGLIGRLVSPHVQPKLLFIAPIFFGAVGHLIGMMMLATPLDDAFVSGKISHLSLPMPLDYVAGSLMGVAIGLGWARSFLHHEEESGHAAPLNRSV